MFFDDDINQKTQVNINKFHFKSQIFLNEKPFITK
jgi:hypothetical protein